MFLMNMNIGVSKTTYSIIGLCLFTLLIIFLLRYFVPLWVMNILTVLCVITLVYSLYKFTKLEKLARELFR